MKDILKMCLSDMSTEAGDLIVTQAIYLSALCIVWKTAIARSRKINDGVTLG